MAPIGELRFADFAERRRVARAGRVLAAQAAAHRAAGLPALAVVAFDHVGRSVELWGRYERDELELLMRCLGPRVDRAGLVLDIGANIGNHALFFAEQFAEVFAFEPNPRTHAVLALNAALRDNVRCFALALSDRAGTATLEVPAGNLGMASLRPDRAKAADEGGETDGAARAGGVASGATSTTAAAMTTVPVPLQRLDDLPELTGRRVALVKIDVEGHEAAVLRGARALLERDRPVVVFEQLAEEIEGGASAALEALRAAGYRRFWTVEDFPRGGGRWLDALRRRVLGAGLRMVEVQRLERRFHPMIVALPPSW